MSEKTPLLFITGRAGSGKSTAVLDGMRASLAAGRKIFLIVPEQQAVVWESRAARKLPADSALQMEIVSFTRLANLVARTVGGLSYRYITKGGKCALMYSALRTLAPTLSFYGGEKRPERTVPALLAANSELKRAGVSPAKLLRAAEELAEDPPCERIAARTRDLALLRAAYGEMLRTSYEDDEDELAHLAEQLGEVDFFDGCDVFVDSFFSLTPVECDILYHIFRQAENVTVTFAADPSDRDKAHLAAPLSFFDAMRRTAERAHRAVSIAHLTENRRAQTEALRHLEENLWNFSAPPAHFPGDTSVRVTLAKDRYEEAEACTCRIAELVRGGARYGEIAVIARHVDPLRGILDSALRRHGIPYFLAVRSGIDSEPAARLLLGALSAVSGGWRQEDILRMAKTGLANLSDDECDALQSYTDTWHIRGQRAFENPWNMNPDGYVPTLSARGEKILLAANGARDKLIVPLLRFSSVFEKGEASVPDISRALYELLCDYGVWDALAEQSRRAAEVDARRASELSQLWGILMECLDTLAQTLPDTRTDAAAYAALLRQVLAAAHVGAIPGGIDEVVIGEANQVRLGEVAHVILLGAAEGEFPGTPAEDGFFSDTDRIRLEGVGITLSGTSDERMKEELFWFYRALSLPQKSLTVLIPEKDGSTALYPSMGAERVLALLPAVQKTRFSSLPDAQRIFSDTSARAAVRSADEITVAALASLGITPAPHADLPISVGQESVSPETAAVLFPREISLTQSRLDLFVLCRFGYYCKYIARLEEEKSARFAASTVGTFVHRVLELFFAKLDGRTLPICEEDLHTYTEQIVTQCVTEILPGGETDARAAYLIARLKRCIRPILAALCDEFAESRFAPVRFEMPIGTHDGDAAPALKIPLSDGRTLSLRGTLDRLDIWNDGANTYVRVVDYKTGAKQFSEADVSIGLNVQLLLYLFTILNMPEGTVKTALSGGEGVLLPAGALYFSARPGDTASETMLSGEDAAALVQNSIKRDGILLDDERVLAAMDPSFSGRFIPVTKKSDAPVGKVLRSAEEISALEKSLCETIRAHGERMASGDASAVDPTDAEIVSREPCKYCKMNGICRAAIGKGEN